jgi:hypothetical protein
MHVLFCGVFCSIVSENMRKSKRKEVAVTATAPSSSSSSLAHRIVPAGNISQLVTPQLSDLFRIVGHTVASERQAATTSTTAGASGSIASTTTLHPHGGARVTGTTVSAATPIPVFSSQLSIAATGLLVGPAQGFAPLASGPALTLGSTTATGQAGLARRVGKFKPKHPQRSRVSAEAVDVTTLQVTGGTLNNVLVPLAATSPTRIGYQPASLASISHTNPYAHWFEAVNPTLESDHLSSEESDCRDRDLGRELDPDIDADVDLDVDTHADYHQQSHDSDPDARSDGDQIPYDDIEALLDHAGPYDADDDIDPAFEDSLPPRSATAPALHINNGWNPNHHHTHADRPPSHLSRAPDVYEGNVHEPDHDSPRPSSINSQVERSDDDDDDDDDDYDGSAQHHHAFHQSSPRPRVHVSPRPLSAAVTLTSDITVAASLVGPEQVASRVSPTVADVASALTFHHRGPLRRATDVTWRKEAPDLHASTHHHRSIKVQRGGLHSRTARVASVVQPFC